MADTKIADLVTLATVANDDWVVVVDISDTTDGASGTTKKAARSEFKGDTGDTGPAGAGDVSGPGSSTDNAIVRFDGTTGSTIQNSVVTIADTTGNVAGVGTLSSGAITSTGASSFGSITLATDLAVADGGTGASTAAGALTNLGLTATAPELNTLDGITATVAELNILDGVTSTAAELNALDGITATVTELNYTDGVTSAIQTQLDGKTTASSTTTFTNKTFNANGTGNSISNIDVADLANGTDGQLITWDANGAPATVATGTSGQVLTSNGVGAAPTFQAAASGGVWTSIETKTPTSLSSTVFSTGLSGYTVYKLICVIKGAANIDKVYIRINGDTTNTNYQWAGSFTTNGAWTANVVSSSDTNGMQMSDRQGCDTNGRAMGEITIFKPSGTDRTTAKGDFSSSQDTVNNGSQSLYAGAYKTNDAITSITLAITGTTFDTSGTRITLIGMA